MITESSRTIHFRMKHILKYILPIHLAFFLFSCHPKENNDVFITPKPVSVKTGEGYFRFSDTTVIAVENEEQAVIANLFAKLFTTSAGFTPKVKINTQKGNVRFITDKNLSHEAYTINVTPDVIKIRASDVNGFFYALQTLRLSLPAPIDGKYATNTDYSIQAMTVNDKPCFSYRGFMLDVSRYFMPKEELLRIIDCMSMLKLNTLHLHLSDDNGWRLEIKKYPRLTEIGAWRADRGNTPFPDRENPVKGEPTPIGGFYTQKDMKEIISYASDRQIEVIPEIDIPAHSNAALAAYPEYACPVVSKFIGVLPGLGGNNADIVFCAGNDKTFSFLQDIYDEVMDIFPSRYIHIGGDEAWKTYWKKCPLCQKRIKKEGLHDEEALQGYFMNRISKYIQGKGREVMGWDELTNSVVPENAVVFGWQGKGEAALKAAKQRHRFVLTPAEVLYLIRYQGPQWHEPLTYFGNNTLKDVYDYEPVKPSWEPEYENLLLGVQGSMWTEFCHKPEDVTYMIFPRLVALAEVAWSSKGEKNWNSFLKALDNYDSHLDAKGIVYAKSMYNIQHSSTPKGDCVEVELQCIRPDVEIRYTTDGTEPANQSDLYTTPLNIYTETTVKACTFLSGQQIGQVLEIPIIRNMATGKQTIDAKGNEKLLTNGIRGSLRQSDFEWCTWRNELNPLLLTLDLEKKETIHHIKIGCLTNYGMAVHKPRAIEIEISEDGNNFKSICKKVYNDSEIFRKGNFVEDIEFENINGKARYIRISITNAGKNPEWHIRPGQQSCCYFDEIIIE